MAVFLHGGGDDPAGRESTFGPFVDFLRQRRSDLLVLIIAAASEEEQKETSAYYTTLFASLGISPAGIQSLYVTPEQPLTLNILAALNPAGVFVCGGVTPFYHASLCGNLSWVEFLIEKEIPYYGTSAGAAIAGRRAIIGGWQREQHGKVRQILFSGAGEGLDALTVKSGLGLVPFALDVHASQWGTLSRLLHTVDANLVHEGWAIDENTMLAIQDSTIHIYGLGQAYHVQQVENGNLLVAIHSAK